MIRIKKISDDIARIYKPDKIILFGSYAEGRQKESSDVDLLIITDKFKSKKSLIKDILNNFNPEFDLDILVKQREEIVSRIEMNDFF